jgi:hypothetical protein
MRLQKLSIVLLALLLAAMTLVPGVSAGIPDVNNLGNNDQKSIDQVSGGNTNLFEEMGVQKPIGGLHPVPMKGYEESKAEIERIMAFGKLSDDKKSIIGLLDFGSSRLLLINHGDTVLAVTYDGFTIKFSTITPELLGETKTAGSPRPLLPGGRASGDTLTTDTLTRLYSFSIVSPESPSRVLTLYQITKSRTDEYRNYLNEIRASLTAYGVFYVNYGSSVSSVTDQSSYYTTYPYTTCSYAHSASGAGTTAGQVNAHLKTGAAFARAQMDNWVSCDAWLSTNDGGSTGTWMSGNGDGCTG